MASDDKIVSRMMTLFAGAKTAHGTHGEPEQNNLKWIIKNSARTLREAVTPKLWQEHLAGKRPLGIIPIAEDSSCSWGAVDVDDYSMDQLDVIKRVEAAKLPLVPCQSKSGGLHLFLFAKSPVPAAIMQATLKAIAAKLGVADSEIFPKQVSVDTERGDLGNWMIMPYYGDTFNGRLQEQIGIKATGLPMTVTEFLDFAESRRVDNEKMQELQKIRPSQAKAKKGMNGHAHLGGDPKVPFSDGPVCLEILASQGVKAGMQNETLFNMGLYYKLAFPDDWEERLARANEEFLTPPGSADGLASVIKQLKKKDYQYGCKKRPLCDHCNAAVCRLRKFGVGEGADHLMVSGLTKLGSEPALWFLNVGDKKERLQFTTEQLLDFRQFARISASIAKYVPAVMSQGAWHTIMKGLIEAAEELPVTEEISRTGQFKEVLEEFLTNRQRARTKEDILSGRPWESEEDGVYYFQMKDFSKFLQRENIMKDLTRIEMGEFIKKLDGKNTVLRIGPKTVRVWAIPRDAFDEKTPLATPKMDGHPI